MKWMGISGVFVLGFFALGYFLTAQISEIYTERNVLSFSSENKTLEVVTPSSTPTPLPSSTPTPTPTPTPAPKPTNIIPTPTTVAQPKITPEEIHGLLQRFSGQYSVDVNVLRHIAVCESGFNPGAVNGPYAGLYQFNISTWKNNRLLMGEDSNPDLRYNAEEAIQTAAYLISLGKFHLWPNCHP